MHSGKDEEIRVMTLGTAGGIKLKRPTVNFMYCRNNRPRGLSLEHVPTVLVYRRHSTALTPSSFRSDVSDLLWVHRSSKVCPGLIHGLVLEYYGIVVIRNVCCGYLNGFNAKRSLMKCES